MRASFYVLAYNHEKLIADAIKAALAQTYTPLQIIVSDDCSTDATWEIIQQTVANYKGPHSLILRRNSTNLGISCHINAVWAVCSGEWIFASAGDDISSPERVEKVMSVVGKNNNIKLALSWLRETDEHDRFLYMNKLGVESVVGDAALFTIFDRFTERTYVQHGAAMAYSREIADFFGPLPNGVIFEDDIINIRGELLGSVGVLPLPLVNHRNHKGQVTQILVGISDRTREERRAMRLLSAINSRRQNLEDVKAVDWLPEDIRRSLLQRLEAELLKETKVRDAVIGCWPLKLISLVGVIRGYSINIFGNDDLMRALLPYFLYRFFRRIRG